MKRTTELIDELKPIISEYKVLFIDYKNEFINLDILNKYYKQVIAILIGIILLICVYNRFKTPNQLRPPERYHAFKTMIEANKDYKTFLLAQLFLDNSKNNLLTICEGCREQYNKNGAFRKDMDNIHSVDYYIAQNKINKIKQFSRMIDGNQYLIDIDKYKFKIVKFQIITNK